MFELARAAAKPQRAEAADRAGVRIRHRMRGARQHEAEFRRDHMADALLGIVEIEKPDAVLAAALAHRALELRAIGIGRLVASGLRRDRMILHREGEIGAAHAAAGRSSFSNACGA